MVPPFQKNCIIVPGKNKIHWKFNLLTQKMRFTFFPCAGFTLEQGRGCAFRSISSLTQKTIAEDPVEGEED